MAIKILKNANLLHKRTHQGDSIKKRIDMVSKAILNIENEKRKFINIWLEAKNLFQFPTELINTYGLGDDGISYPVHDKKMSGLRVGAVDGSVLRESMLGIDLIASKARGVVFNFKKDSPPDVSYYPVETNSNFNLFGVFQGSSFREIEFYSNVERLLAELELVHQVIARENNLDLMIIDGSLYFPEILKENTDNFYIKKFNKQIAQVLMKILNLIERKDVLLVGVVKDSMKRDFVEILGKAIPYLVEDHEGFKKLYDLDFRRILSIFKDYDFFFRFLQEGERSFMMKTFPRTVNPNPRTDFEKFIKDKHLGIYSFLLKPVPMDFPLKLEFFSSGKPKKLEATVDALGRLINPISKIMVDYSEPSPQMEAHKRVCIPEQDFKTIVNLIRQNTGYCSTLLSKRRDRRPF